MKPFKNKLAVTIVLLSVAFCGMIIYSLQSDANGISSSVSTVVSPLQKIVYNINSRVKETVDFFLNFSEVKLENEELKKKKYETCQWINWIWIIKRWSWTLKRSFKFHWI